MGEFVKYEYVSLPHPLISLYTQMYNMYVYLHPLKLSLSLSHSFSLYLSLFLSLPLPLPKLSVHLSLASFPKYQNLHLTQLLEVDVTCNTILLQENHEFRFKSIILTKSSSH